MIPYRNNKLAVWALVAFFVLVGAYAYFEARNILYGPKIYLSMGSETITMSEKFILIEGNTKNITGISMNGRVIPVTEEGTFAEALILHEGYNSVLLEAHDKLGRKTSKKIEIVYKPKDDETNIN